MMSNSRMPWLFTVLFDIVLSFLPVGCGFILGSSRVCWILFFATSSLQGPLLNRDFGPRIEIRIFANKSHVFLCDRLFAGKGSIPTYTPKRSEFEGSSITTLLGTCPLEMHISVDDFPFPVWWDMLYSSLKGIFPGVFL